MDKKHEGAQKQESSKKRSGLLSWEHWQIMAALLVIYDVITVNGSYLIALWLRFDCKFNSIPRNYLDMWMKFAGFYALIVVAVFWVLRLYMSIWRFASFSELLRIGLSSVITGILHIVGMEIMFGHMPVFYYIIGMMFQFVFICGARFAYRFILLVRKSMKPADSTYSGARVMLVGAGAAGQMILRDTHNAAEVRDKVVCIIYD